MQWGVLDAYSINGGTAGIGQMLHGMVAASLQDVIETYEVTLDIAFRIGDTITNTCLCCKIHHYVNLISRENFFDE